MANPPTASSGWTGKGLSFDGVNDVVDSGYSGLNTNSNFTISYWMKTTDSNVVSSGIYPVGVYDGTGYIYAGRNNKVLNQSQFLFHDGATSIGVQYTNSKWRDGNWHLLTFLKSGNTQADLKMYIDGVEITTSIFASGTLGSHALTKNFFIGADNANGTPNYFINALIDDVRIYNRALSAGEVRELFVNPYGDFKPPSIDYRHAGSAKSAKKTLLIRSHYGREKPPLGVLPDPQHPLQKGIVGQWLMNEGGGGTAYDLSGNRNHGTLTNMANPPTASSGWTGKGLSFDGVNDYVDSGYSGLNLNSNFTINYWMKTTDSNVVATGIYPVGVYDGTGYIYAGRNNKILNQSQFLFHDGVTSIGVQYTNSKWRDGNWHLLTFLKSGNTQADLKIYIDGVEITTSIFASGTLGSHALTKNFFIGADNANGTPKYFINALIDDVRIYNRALTAEEVMALYLQFYCMFPKTKISSQMFNTIPQIPRPLLDYGRQPIY
jgi:hypothetical protein